jgi:uncharacterized protein involved in exopolysaccharide biosynthesis
MELKSIPRIAFRWSALIIAVAVVATLTLNARLAATPGVYEAQARIQVTAPSTESVAIVANGSRSSNLRDDLTLARNNVAIVAGSPEVYRRTMLEVGLVGDGASYSVEIRPVRDSDFLDLVVSTQDPERAKTLANTHAAAAVRYYGELRAKPATAAKRVLSEQIQAAVEQIRAPETQATDLRLAKESYDLLVRKYAEADLVERSALQATYVQVVQPAVAPSAPIANRRYLPLMALAVVGSLGVGLVVALLLDSLLRWTRRPRRIPTTQPVAPYPPGTNGHGNVSQMPAPAPH